MEYLTSTRSEDMNLEGRRPRRPKKHKLFVAKLVIKNFANSRTRPENLG